MELIYAALLLHSAGKEINEKNVKKVLDACEIKVDDARIKALVAALEGVNIDEAVKKSVPAPVAAPAPKEEPAKEEEKKGDEEEKKEEAAEGLSALFG